MFSGHLIYNTLLELYNQEFKTSDFYSHISQFHFSRTVQTTVNNGRANVFCHDSTV